MWGVRAAEPAGVRGLRTREYGCRRNQFSSPSIRSGDTASIQCPRVVCAHVRTSRERLRFRPSPPCDVRHECSRFPYAAVQIVGRSSSTRVSLAEPSAESGECPLSVGSMVARYAAIWRSNVPDPMTWVPSAFTRVRSFASEVYTRDAARCECSCRSSTIRSSAPSRRPCLV